MIKKKLKRAEIRLRMRKTGFPKKKRRDILN